MSGFYRHSLIIQQEKNEMKNGLFLLLIYFAHNTHGFFLLFITPTEEHIK